MQYVGESGVTVGELQRLARAPKLPLAGMVRWGYVTVEPKTARSQRVIRATAKGRMAQEVWRPLFGAMEKRWELRFGQGEIQRLRDSLAAVARQLDTDLPDYLPLLGYGFCTEVLSQNRRSPAVVEGGLPALLSKVLLAFTLDFDSESDLSLAMSANVLRLLDESGVRVRDFPRRAGVSKEAIQMALGFLAKRRLIVLGPDPTAARAQLVRLTAQGGAAQDSYRKLLGDIEKRWQARFGEAAIQNLRQPLERLAGQPNAASPLFQGLTPPAGGWRASVPQPETLPHHPMVLHRGGYPDGS